MGHRVKLTYFKASGGVYGLGGKCYSEGSYETQREAIYSIFEEVYALKEAGKLPGLVDGAAVYHVLVEVPGHPHDHPHLVVHAPPHKDESKKDEALRAILPLVKDLAAPQPACDAEGRRTKDFVDPEFARLRDLVKEALAEEEPAS